MSSASFISRFGEKRLLNVNAMEIILKYGNIISTILTLYSWLLIVLFICEVEPAAAACVASYLVLVWSDEV